MVRDRPPVKLDDRVIPLEAGKLGGRVAHHIGNDYPGIEFEACPRICESRGRIRSNPQDWALGLTILASAPARWMELHRQLDLLAFANDDASQSVFGQPRGHDPNEAIVARDRPPIQLYDCIITLDTGAVGGGVAEYIGNDGAAVTFEASPHVYDCCARRIQNDAQESALARAELSRGSPFEAASARFDQSLSLP
jgi:hypothetical protein